MVSFRETKTYHTLSPFRAESSPIGFMHNSYFTRNNYEDLSRGNSIKGRAISLLKLVLQPFNIILKIARKTAHVVLMVIFTIAVALRIGQQRYFSELGRSVRNLLDHLGSLAVTPFAQTAATVRFLFGVIHPGFVFGLN